MFRNKLAEFVYLRTYARWIENKGRRETWDETCSRVTRFLDDAIQDNKKLTLSEKMDLLNRLSEIDEKIYNMQIMPSMRLMQFAGEPAKRNNACIFNCCYVAPTKLEDFADIMFLLLSGCGVGFSVEEAVVQELPKIKFQKLKATVTQYVIEDNREGWAQALYTGLAIWYEGKDVNFDCSKIRAAGAKLKTTGGRASGPEPLRELLGFARSLILQRQGKRLKTINVHDLICKMGECVVAGGVRRSALISLSDIDDNDLKTAKQGQFYITHGYRSMANNSTVYNETPSDTELMDEWLSLAKAGTGERGIFNRTIESLTKTLPKRRQKVLGVKKIRRLGTNPSLRACTKVLTNKGIFKIEDLEGKEINVYNLHGNWSRAKCFLSGENKPLIKLTLQNGATVFCTVEHTWPVLKKEGKYHKISTSELCVGDEIKLTKIEQINNSTIGTYEDGFLLGWLYGDGAITKRSDTQRLQYNFTFSGEKYLNECHTLVHEKLKNITGTTYNPSIRNREGLKTWYEYSINNDKLTSFMNEFGVEDKNHLPELLWRASDSCIKGFIDALFTSDGSVDTYSKRIVLTSSRANILAEVQELLGFYGIYSKIYLRKSIKGGTFPNKKVYDKIYNSYVLRVDRPRCIEHFRKLFSLKEKTKQNKLNSLKFITTYLNDTIKINKIERTNLVENVYDITVFDSTHCFKIAHCVTGNCGEVYLQSKQMCNLCEVIIRPEDTEKTIIRKVMYATILGTIQSTFTNFHYISPEWKINCDEERLLGVSLTGIYDNPLTCDNELTFKEVKEDCGVCDLYELVDSPLNRLLKKCKKAARRVNRMYADLLGINHSTAITCIKPSGTVSQVVDCASGIHPRYAKYYIRRVRINVHDPLLALLKAQGIPYKPEVGQSVDTMTTAVIEFPVKAPDGCVTKNDIRSYQHFLLWQQYKQDYTEHNPSVTISVAKDEWVGMLEWVRNSFTEVGGVSFLPKFDHVYQLAPYEEITEEKYLEMEEVMKNLDFSKLPDFEKEDTTDVKREYACTSGGCEI